MRSKGIATVSDTASVMSEGREGGLEDYRADLMTELDELDLRIIRMDRDRSGLRRSSASLRKMLHALDLLLGDVT